MRKSIIPHALYGEDEHRSKDQLMLMLVYSGESDDLAPDTFSFQLARRQLSGRQATAVVRHRRDLPPRRHLRNR
jgi:hypothetical protein